jgi:acetylglutamate kinase
LTVNQALSLISDQTATGGMQAKIEAAITALRHGTGEVLIAPGAQVDILQALLSGASAGTRLVPE